MNQPEPQDTPAAEAPRPWGAAGRVRRDRPPHRSSWLLVLSGAALVSGVLSFLLTVLFLLLPYVCRVVPRAMGLHAVLCFSWLPLLPVSAAIIGMTVGLSAVVMARQDVNRMTVGGMDPAGLRLARVARGFAVAALILGSLRVLWFALCLWTR